MHGALSARAENRLQASFKGRLSHSDAGEARDPIDGSGVRIQCDRSLWNGDEKACQEVRKVQGCQEEPQEEVRLFQGALLRGLSAATCHDSDQAEPAARPVCIYT